MHPFFREVDLHTIDIGDIILGKFLFYFCQDSIYIDIWSQFYFLLGNEVRRIGSTQFACLHLLLCQMSQEQGDTHQSITTVMAGRIDHTSIAFATDNSISRFHLRYDIHFAHCCRIVLATMSTGNVTQSTA